MANLKFIELPVEVSVKTNTGTSDKVRDVAICFNPPVEMMPHPLRESSATLLITSNGTKTVELPYAEVLKRMKAYDA
jgi:hypothetical protein